MQVEVDEGEVRAQPMVVLGDASVSHLVEAEDTLQDRRSQTLNFSLFKREAKRRTKGLSAEVCEIKILPR